MSTVEKIRRLGVGVLIVGLLVAVVPVVLLGVPGGCEGDCATGAGPFVYFGVVVAIAGVLVATVSWVGGSLYRRLSV